MNNDDNVETMKTLWAVEALTTLGVLAYTSCATLKSRGNS